MKIKRIEGLDGLRGIAACIVMLTHMSAWGYKLAPWLDLSHIGRSGVLLFFVLSAFLLTSQVLNWQAGQITSKSKWASYAIARIFRILPLFLIVLIVAMASTYIADFPIVWRIADYLRELPVSMTVSSFFEHVLFQSGTDILWTIPVEFKFYVLLPLILIGLFYISRNSYVNTCFILFVYIIIDYVFLSNTSNGTDTLPYISVFLTGVLLSYLVKITDKADLYHSHRMLLEALAWVCVAIYIVLMPMNYEAITGAPLPRRIENSNLVFGSLWAVLIYSMIFGVGFLRKLLESRVLVFIGAISYSIYLWHRIPIKLMHRFEYFGNVEYISATEKTYIVIFGTIALAYLSYRFIEIPFLRIGNKLRNRTIAE